MPTISLARLSDECHSGDIINLIFKSGDQFPVVFREANLRNLFFQNMRVYGVNAFVSDNFSSGVMRLVPNNEGVFLGYDSDRVIGYEMLRCAHQQ